MEVIIVLSGRLRSCRVKDVCGFLERGAQGKLKAVPFLRRVSTERSVRVVRVPGLSPLPLTLRGPGGGLGPSPPGSCPPGAEPGPRGLSGQHWGGAQRHPGRFP